MNIELGKIYKTRDGRKAYIYSIVYSVPGIVDPYPVKGVISGPCISDFCCSWTKAGSHLRGPNSGEQADLVSEWSNPRMLAYIDGTGAIYVSRADEPHATQRAPWLDEPENKND